MRVHCDACGLFYDDLYRLTYCPHDEFGMRTRASRGDGTERVCTSIEELKAYMEKEIGPDDPYPSAA